VAVSISFLMVHTVTVEPYEGEKGSGPKYGPGAPIKCLITEVRKLVRDSTGKEVVSERGFICEPGEAIKPDDMATIRGRRTKVLAVGLVDGGGLPTPDNIEVSCA
jgi:hypothetical protein